MAEGEQSARATSEGLAISRGLKGAGFAMELVVREYICEREHGPVESYLIVINFPR